jgi:hypothetical protein
VEGALRMDGRLEISAQNAASVQGRLAEKNTFGRSNSGERASRATQSKLPFRFAA